VSLTLSYHIKDIGKSQKKKRLAFNYKVYPYQIRPNLDIVYIMLPFSTLFLNEGEVLL
jgi:hypothetical protein